MTTVKWMMEQNSWSLRLLLRLVSGAWVYRPFPGLPIVASWLGLPSGLSLCGPLFFGNSEDGSVDGRSVGALPGYVVGDGGTVLVSIDPDGVVSGLEDGCFWLHVRGSPLSPSICWGEFWVAGVMGSGSATSISMVILFLPEPGILITGSSAFPAEIIVVFVSVIVVVMESVGVVALGERKLVDLDLLDSFGGSISLLVLILVYLLDFFQPNPYLGGVKPYRGGLYSFCKMVVVLFLPLGSLFLAFFGGESSYGGGMTTDRGGSLLQKGAQVLWKVPPLILSFGGWLCLGVFSSEGKLSGLCPMCFDAAVPKLFIYLWLWFVLLEGDVHSQIHMGSDLCGVVPWLWW